MSVTPEHYTYTNLVHLITDSTVTKLDYDDVGDLIMELTHIYDRMEEIEITRDRRES